MHGLGFPNTPLHGTQTDIVRAVLIHLLVDLVRLRWTIGMVPQQLSRAMGNCSAVDDPCQLRALRVSHVNLHKLLVSLFRVNSPFFVCGGTSKRS